MDVKYQCQTCRYYNNGECFRYPPEIVADVNFNLDLQINGQSVITSPPTYTSFTRPSVSTWDFCGEHSELHRRPLFDDAIQEMIEQAE